MLWWPIWGRALYQCVLGQAPLYRLSGLDVSNLAGSMFTQGHFRQMVVLILHNFLPIVASDSTHYFHFVSDFCSLRQGWSGEGFTEGGYRGQTLRIMLASGCLVTALWVVYFFSIFSSGTTAPTLTMSDNYRIIVFTSRYKSVWSEWMDLVTCFEQLYMVKVC